MYKPNLERNKLTYELWEKSLPVSQISSLTGIPRSTVGYYVRKFNRLVVEGKPVVFPSEHKAQRESSPQLLDMMKAIGIEGGALQMFRDGKYQKLYYMLMDLKLLKEFGIMPRLEYIKKALVSLS